jgi:ABC-type phosphate transport system permease subunit
MNTLKVIITVVLTLGIVFGMLMFLCWVQLIEFLPYNSLVGFLILALSCLVLDLLDRYVSPPS